MSNIIPETVKISRFSRWMNPVLGRKAVKKPGEALAKVAGKLRDISLCHCSFDMPLRQKFLGDIKKLAAAVVVPGALFIGLDHFAGPLFGTSADIANDLHLGASLGLPLYLIGNRLNLLRRRSLAKAIMRYGDLEQVTESWRVLNTRMRKYLLCFVKDPERISRFINTNPQDIPPRVEISQEDDSPDGY